MLKRFILLLVLWPVTGYSAYITDKLLAEMYAAPSNSEEHLQLLPSGTPVELMTEKDGFVKIKLVDGKSGWVEKRFLSEDKPAEVRLLMLQGKYRQVQKELDLAEKKLVEAEALVLKTKAKSVELLNLAKEARQAGLEKALKEIPGLREELTQQKPLEKALRESGSGKGGSSSGMGWLALFLMLILGAAVGAFAGMFIQDRKQLERHGGFRI